MYKRVVTHFQAAAALAFGSSSPASSSSVQTAPVSPAAIAGITRKPERPANWLDVTDKSSGINGLMFLAVKNSGRMTLG